MGEVVLSGYRSSVMVMTRGFSPRSTSIVGGLAACKYGYPSEVQLKEELARHRGRLVLISGARPECHLVGKESSLKPYPQAAVGCNTSPRKSILAHTYTYR